MRILRLAVESQRWDLAAHTIVLATARILHKGELNASKSGQKSKCRQGQPKR